MFTIHYVVSPIGDGHQPVAEELARSVKEAIARAKANLPAKRRELGANAYRIVDPSGVRVAIGPGVHEADYSAFRPVELKDGSGWYVLYTPDDYGAPLQKNGFATEQEALDRIKHESAGWLSKKARP